MWWCDHWSAYQKGFYRQICHRLCIPGDQSIQRHPQFQHPLQNVKGVANPVWIREAIDWQKINNAIPNCLMGIRNALNYWHRQDNSISLRFRKLNVLVWATRVRTFFRLSKRQRPPVETPFSGFYGHRPCPGQVVVIMNTSVVFKFYSGPWVTFNTWLRRGIPN